MRRRLSRRTMLRGIGGATLGLPLLEAMMPRSAQAAADAIPTRYIFCYAGTSSGRFRTANEGEVLVPDAYGSMPEVGLDRLALQPLVDEGVLGDVSLVSNLVIPWGNAGSLAPGGRVTDLNFHFGPTITPQLSGLKALEFAVMNGASSDQLLVQSQAPDTVFPSLSYRAQAVQYLGGGATSTAGRISFRDDGGSIVPIDPIASPQLAYQTLFSSFTPPEATPEMLAARQRRVGVLDRVADAARDLLPTLGAADRLRVERHLHEVELFESQLSANPPGVSSECSVLPDPGADPPIGELHIGEGPTGANAAWSDEDRRAEIFSDLLRMAVTCDLTRYATLQYTNWKSWMSAYHIGQGWDVDIHEVGHSGLPKEAWGDVVGWHTGHFARLVRILRDTPEWDGSSVLDHTVLVLCFEGGHGLDPIDGSYSTHSTENMAVLVAGGAGGLVPGQHINGNQRHPAQATLTAMQAAGYEGNFGDFANGIPELFG